MVLSRFGFFALAASLTLTLPVAHADTFSTGGSYSGFENNFTSGLISFTFNGTSENAAAGNIAGSSAVIGSAPSIALSEVFCVDLYDDIYLNTTYTATIDTTGSVKGATVTNDGQIAWLLINIQPSPVPSTTDLDANEALQAAIWTEEYGSNFVLSSSNDAGMIQDYCSDLGKAGTAPPSALCGNSTPVTANTVAFQNILAADVSQVDWITPLNNGVDDVQAQVGLPPAPPGGRGPQGTPPGMPATPEPGGLVLLGTGLLGVAGAVRRRFRS